MCSRELGGSADQGSGWHLLLVGRGGLHALWLVVSGERQDDAHDALQIALRHLLAGDVCHADPFGRHELQDAVQVLSHGLGRDGLPLPLPLDAGNTLSS